MATGAVKDSEWETISTGSGRADDWETISAEPARDYAAEHAANRAISDPTFGQALGQFGSGVVSGAMELPGKMLEAGKGLYNMASEEIQRSPTAGPMVALGKAGLALAEGIPAYAGEAAGRFLYGSPEDVGRLVGENALPLAVGKAAKTIQGMRATRNASIEGVVSPKTQSELIRGIKPINRKTEFKQTLQRSVPEVVESSEALKRPIKGLADVEVLVPDAKKRVWKAYEAKLGPNAQATIDGNTVADAMESAITKRFETQNPGKAEAIREVARTYRRSMTLDEAEDFLQGANGDLEAYYAKNKVGRDVAAKDPEWGHIVREAETLRKQLYAKLDELAGPDAAELKRTYGSLTSLQEEVLRRKNVADRQNPTSLAEQISFAQSAGRALKAAANLNLGDAASAIGQPLVARYLKNRGSSDALIERGFGRFKPKQKQPNPISGGGGAAGAQPLSGTIEPDIPPQYPSSGGRPNTATVGSYGQRQLSGAQRQLSGRVDTGTRRANQALRPSGIRGSLSAQTATSADTAQEAISILDAITEKYKHGLPTKTNELIFKERDSRGVGTGAGLRNWVGENVNDIPILQDVPHGAEAIEQALRVRKGKVWDRIVQEAEEYVRRNKEEGRVAGLEDDIPF